MCLLVHSKCFLKLKNIITEIKYLLHRFNSTLYKGENKTMGQRLKNDSQHKIIRLRYLQLYEVRRT